MIIMENSIINLQRKVKNLNDENNKIYKQLKEKDKQLDKSNNIIIELEKTLLEKIEYSKAQRDVYRFTAYEYILNKLNKLKEGSDKNDNL